MSGTSMATPHVSGAASLAFAYRPNATVAEVKSALMNGGDTVAALAGKTVSGKRLNLLGMLNALPSDVVPVPPPAPTPTVSGDGLAATYFDNKDFTGKSASRGDKTVNFNWSSGAPISGFGSDTFSVRWSGFVVPAKSETYSFYTNTDDGVRLWVNGKLLVDRWSNKGASEYSGSITLVGGQAYAIKMEYFENTGKAQAQLRWSSASVAKQIVPQSALFSSDPTVTTAGVASTGGVFSSTTIASMNDLLKDETAVLI
jgi:hypothetical protein